MSSIHSQWKQIPDSEIDDLIQVDHQNYILWMREIAYEHFAQNGFDKTYFAEKKQRFVVRRHKVEHLSSSVANDQLLLVTWISELGKKAAKRQHRIFKVDEFDQYIPVISAQSVSVFVDAEVNPAPIPAEIAEVMIPISQTEVDAYIRALDSAPGRLEARAAI